MNEAASIPARLMPAAAPIRPVLGERRSYWLFLAPALVLMGVFYVYPLCRVLLISVTEPELGLGNYAQLASAPVIRVAMTTARICVLTTLITLVLSYVVAYVLTNSSRTVARIMLLGVLLPLWVSVLVRTFAWIALLRREGLVNSVLLSAGAIESPLSLVWNEVGVVIGIVHYMLPYGILPLAANMRQIDRSLMAAARGLGARPLGAFLRVFLPLSVPGIIASSVLVFIFSLGFYVTPVLLGGGRTVMITEYISMQILDILRWGMGTMLATSLLMFVFALFGIMSWFVDLRQVFGAK